MIRLALPIDAASLAALAEKTFRESLGGLNSKADMELHCRTHFGEAIQAGEISAPAHATLLVESEGMQAGFAQLRWGRAPECVIGESPGEIARFYLLRDFHGSGVASKLMQACLDTLGQQGCKIVWLGVWQKNPRAIAFYRRHGFVEVGEQIFVLGNDRQRDFVLARPIDQPRKSLATM